MHFTKRVLLTLAVFSLVEFTTLGEIQILSTVQAETLSSSLLFKVKKIAANIAKSRESLAANKIILANDEFKARQFMQRIDSYASALSKMPEVDDPTLTLSKKELASLQNEFQAAMSGDQTMPGPVSKTPQTNAGAELVSGQRVRVKKLAGDINNVANAIVIKGPSELQSSDNVGNYNKRLQQFADALTRYEAYKLDPDVKVAASNYQQLVAKLTAEQERAQGQLAQLDDAQKRIAAISQELRSNSSINALYPPFNESDAKHWIAQLSQTKQSAIDLSSEMKSIASIAYLPENIGVPEDGSPYDIKDLQRLFRNAEGIVTKVNESVTTTQNTLKQRFDFQDEVELKSLREMDPDNDHHRANLYLKDGAEGEMLAQIDKQMALAQSVSAYQRAFGKEPTGNTKARIAEIASLRATYLSDRQALLGDSKLPLPASENAERIAVAMNILANKEYGFGEHGPVILTTAEIITREKEVSRDTIKDVDVSLSGTITLGGTRETWQYKWDEFKFATPIKHENGDWHVWWITAKKYVSGWEKTPIGQWVSGSTVQGSLILPENF